MAGGGSLSINRPDRLSDREVAPTGVGWSPLIVIHSVDPTLQRLNPKAGGQCPPYNFNSLDGRDGRSLLQESVGLP